MFIEAGIISSKVLEESEVIPGFSTAGSALLTLTFFKGELYTHTHIFLHFLF